MQLKVNGEEKKFDKNVKTLADIIGKFDIKTKYFAVMLNTEIIPKKNLPQTSLKDDDEVEIVHMVGGG